MNNLLKINKNDYYDIIVNGEFSQGELYKKVNKEKSLTKMLGLNLIENLVQDYIGLFELDSSNKEDFVKVIIQDFSDTKKESCKSHIEVLKELFKISSDEVKIIEINSLEQKALFIKKGELLKTNL